MKNDFTPKSKIGEEYIEEKEIYPSEDYKLKNETGEEETIKIKLIDKYGKILGLDKNPIDEAKMLLKKGNIVAIKGSGGFHLVCDGKNYKAIGDLRKNKNIKSKPLALMMQNTDEVKKYCYLMEKEKRILMENKNPIVILKKKNNVLPNNISFNNNTFGVMLPNISFYNELFDEELNVLVITSGNISGKPIIYKNIEAIETLKNVADYFLIHNKDIFYPKEDPVVKVILNEERIMRVGRGYIPPHFKCNNDNIYTLKTISNNHPNYFNHNYIKHEQIEKIPVYHHHAHIVSCMFENNINEKVIGLSFDKIGYGKDKNLWGSEFLICDKESFKRVGHLKYMKMPGGSSAIKEPWKMGVSLLQSWSTNKLNLPVEDIISNLNINNLFSYIKYKNYNTVSFMIKNNMNTPLTSSMERLFDGISSLLNFQNIISYDGEASTELENLAKKSENIKDYYKFEINYRNNQFIVGTDEIVEGVFKDVILNINPTIIAMKFHNTVVEFSFRICLYLRKLYNLNIVALSGGVFENEIIFTRLYEKLNNNNFRVIAHKILPCNDYNLPIGLLIIDMNKK